MKTRSHCLNNQSKLSVGYALVRSEAAIKKSSLGVCFADKVAVGSIVADDRSQPEADLRNQALLTPKYTTKRPVAEVVSAVATNHSCRRLTCSTSHYNFSELIPRGPNLRSVHLARPHLLASELGRCHSGLTSEKASEMGLVRIAEHQSDLCNCHLVLFEVLLGDIDTQPFDFAR